MFLIIYPTSFSSFLLHMRLVCLQYSHGVSTCCFLLVCTCMHVANKLGALVFYPCVQQLMLLLYIFLLELVRHCAIYFSCVCWSFLPH